MHKFFNACLVMAVLVSAFFLYKLEHTTRGYEHRIATLKNNIANEREAIKLLDAEWASLTRPDRLQRLAEEHLHLSTIRASQLVTLQELGQRVPQEPVAVAAESESDAIADIVKEMQQ